MTPQLQQAIRLLQLSTVDLELEIQEALDSNFMLEEYDPESDSGTDDATGETEADIDRREHDQTATSTDANDFDSNDTHNDNHNDNIDNNNEIGDDAGDYEAADEAGREFETGGGEDYVDQVRDSNPELDGDLVPDTSAEVSNDQILDDLPVDSSWDDVFDDSYSGESSGSTDFSDENYLETRNSEEITVQSHLLEQINLLHLSDQDRFIALTIIDGLDEDGILTITIEEILESMPLEWEIESDEVEAVLHLIQHLDPVGIASRSLDECLTIQLKQLPATTPCRDIALGIVGNYLGYLANRDYAYLCRKLRIKENQLKETIELIQSLNPRPGSHIASQTTDYIEPDVIVSRLADRWQVELNPKSTPRIRVNPQYVALIKRGDSSDDSTHLRNHLQEAKWFIKSLQQRNDTLLRVATKIVEYQRGFLEYGEQAMKPLILHDIAEAVELHESTISRVTTQKYMHTPTGVYELKYFFSSHVSTHSGGEVSSTAIRALIKKLVSEENPGKPLSDSKIAKLLAEQNINVARRTIAKYREGLLIPPSNERKQLI